MSIARRAIHSTAYSVTANSFQTLVQLVRSILLAQMLDVNVFGVYAFASSCIVLTRSLGKFGLGPGLLHRARESEGEIALRVHFTLSLIFGCLWALGLAVTGPLLIPSSMSSEARGVLWVLVAVEFVSQLTDTAHVLLVRRIVFRRIAMVNVSVTSLGAVVAVLMAGQGFGVWSLVATDVIRAAVLFGGYYVYRPVWRPRLAWSWDVVRYFTSFGRKSFVAGLVLQALDRLDDLWAGFFLGETQLGFYSRAYRFAVYPRAMLAAPLNAVAAGTYAELKEQPKRLSRAFFRINAFLVRSGFLLAGLLALVAPEFIRLAIGAKWLPMLAAFRLMLVFTLLDPIKVTVSSLFVAVGCPEKTVRARLVQLVVLVVGLFALGPRWGIAGVALAVDLMLVVGIVLLLWQTRAHVQVSLIRLFAVPALALFVSLAAAWASTSIPGVSGSDWRTGIVKAGVFGTLYALVLFSLERRQFSTMLEVLRQLGSKRLAA